MDEIEELGGDWDFTVALSKALQTVPAELLEQNYIDFVLDSTRALAVLSGVEKTKLLIAAVDRALDESHDFYTKLHSSLDTLIEVEAL